MRQKFLKNLMKEDVERSCQKNDYRMRTLLKFLFDIVNLTFETDFL